MTARLAQPFYIGEIGLLTLRPLFRSDDVALCRAAQEPLRVTLFYLSVLNRRVTQTQIWETKRDVTHLLKDPWTWRLETSQARLEA